MNDAHDQNEKVAWESAWCPRNIEGWIGILETCKKRDLVKHCRDTTLYLSDLALLRVACEAGHLRPLRNSSYFRDNVPAHLEPTREEQEALHSASIGPVDGKTAKFIRKVGQIFEERRYLVGHMFFDPENKTWTFFYFDQRDLNDRDNHWEHGSHIHLMSWLTHPRLNPAELYCDFRLLAQTDNA